MLSLLVVFFESPICQRMSQAPWVPRVSCLVEVFHLAADLRPVVQDAAGAGDDGLDGTRWNRGGGFPQPPRDPKDPKPSTL